MCTLVFFVKRVSWFHGFASCIRRHWLSSPYILVFFFGSADPGDPCWSSWLAYQQNSENTDPNSHQWPAESRSFKDTGACVCVCLAPPGNSSYHPHLPPSRVLILALPAVCPEPTTTFAGRSQEGISPKQRPSSHHGRVRREAATATATGHGVRRYILSLIRLLIHAALVIVWSCYLAGSGSFVSLDSCG